MLVKRKSNNWRKVGVIFLLALVLAGASYIVFYSPVFKITAVNVAIADFDASKLQDLIGPDPEGQNLIFWSPADANKKYPEIKDLKISKDYTHRTIQITGSVRDKKFVWCFRSGTDSSASPMAHQGGCFWVDETGYIFTEAPNIEGAALTVVNDGRLVPLEVTDNVLTTSMFNNFNVILNILTELKLPIEDINIEDLSRREFVVLIARGPKITFSLEANTNFVKPGLVPLIKSSSWSKTKTLNLTVEGRVYQGF